MEDFRTKEFTVLTPFSVVRKDVNYSDMTGGCEDDTEVIKIAGYANWAGKESDGTTYVDLTGDVVVPNGVDTSVWLLNPQVLWQHDRVSTIGKGITLERRPDGIYLEAEIHAGAMEEQDWYRVKSGLVCMFSIGFKTLSGEFRDIDGESVFFITKSLLLEVSVVSIPANSKSSFSQIKCLGDGFTSGKSMDTEKGEDGISLDGKTYKEEETPMNIKVKRADLLSETDLIKFKELGGNEAEEVEVSLSSYIKETVAKEVAAILAAKEAEAIASAETAAEAERVALEAKAAEDEAARQEAERVAAEAAELEEKELEADFLELKGLVETLTAAIAVEQK